MARKPEAQFVARVHSHLTTQVYKEGMANPYRGGTPDKYYEGPVQPLWVEYKFLPSVPPIVDIRPQSSGVKLSALQESWLNRAHGNGVFVAVIIGCKEGGIILTHQEWMNPIPREEFKERIQTRKELAAWITKVTTG